VAGGLGTNTMGYSTDGITWAADISGSAMFTNRCWAVAWNGSQWVAGGEGTNRLAYSYDGINWTGSTSGNALITTAVQTVAWNGTYWLAGGAGTNQLAYSSDGITWTASTSGSAIITNTCYGVASRRVLPNVGTTPVNVGATGPTGPTGPVPYAYTPSTPGDWAGADPTTIQEALDRIAAVLTANSMSP
jgi:hypothetical protein